MILVGGITLLFMPLFLSTIYYLIKDPLTPELIRECWRRTKESFKKRKMTWNQETIARGGFPGQSTSSGPNLKSQQLLEEMYGASDSEESVDTSDMSDDSDD